MAINVCKSYVVNNNNNNNKKKICDKINGIAFFFVLRKKEKENLFDFLFLFVLCFVFVEKKWSYKRNLQVKRELREKKR